NLRDCFLPNQDDHIVIGIDWAGQELRLAAGRCQDPTMLSAYVGKPEELKDLHCLTGAGVAKMSYEEFYLAYLNEEDEEHDSVVKWRKLAKRINFGVCVAEGSLIRTERGEIPIEDVTVDDRVWDGNNFVSHRGVVCNGTKLVFAYQGVVATPDHEVFLSTGEKVTLEYALLNSLPLSSAWDTEAEFYTSASPVEARVYDILNAGPNHRFTCNGKLVSNCYLVSAPSLSQQAIVPEAEAEKMLKDTFKTYPGLKKWQEDVVKRARQIGYSETFFGVRKHATDKLWSADGGRKGKQERQLVNYEIQGSAADMLKRLFSMMWKTGVIQDCEVGFVLPVHDEVVASVPRVKALEYIRRVSKLMRLPVPNCVVPMDVDVAISSKSWGQCHEIGSDPTQLDIDRILEKEDA
ncbi:MAG TPA: hypothetical protein ENI81_07225, partial [Phycisphaerales bacterium]|nr:hypothetical protein [Phycisphaerales bacterium]